jgi:hypothetical protein
MLSRSGAVTLDNAGFGPNSWRVTGGKLVSVCSCMKKTKVSRSPLGRDVVITLGEALNPQQPISEVPVPWERYSGRRLRALADFHTCLGVGPDIGIVCSGQ